MHRTVGWVACALMAAVPTGCITGAQQQLRTERYTLNHPDYWKVKKTAVQDGEATLVVIPRYGEAVINEGSGSMSSTAEENYDALTADVEVRLYTWPDGGDGEADPTGQVSKRLMADPDLQLRRHMLIADYPPECGVYPKKYLIFGVQQTPLDLISRPGYRTILVGGRANGVLLGVVARVDYEPDVRRLCHNLHNMRVQLQNLLDGLRASGGPAPRASAGSGAGS
jgi:hypothetical protein